MLEVRQTATFRDWLAELRDRKAQAIIAARIVRLASGLIGDAKRFDGIGELRIDYGPGYRAYFVERQGSLIILLCGGDKGSQKRDIRRAKSLASEV